MTNRHELAAYIDQLLAVATFKDYAPNGLQVEGKASIKKIVTGVTACQALIDAAIAAKADALLVHHGFFWANENPIVVGMKHKRLKALLTHDLNLFAYHLPLDAHPTLGNNVQLAEQLDWPVTGRLGEQGKDALIFHGELATALTAEALSQHLHQKLGRMPLHLSGGGAKIARLAWCTGAAQNYIEQILDKNIDAFISGEVSEYTTHIAREYGIHYFAAGHHATERYGIKALGEHLAQVFQIEHQFIDIDNPV